jgi:hypothetical protein
MTLPLLFSWNISFHENIRDFPAESSVTGSYKPGQDIMPVNDSDNMIPVDDRKAAHVMLHQQFRGRTDRFIRTDSNDIL